LSYTILRTALAAIDGNNDTAIQHKSTGHIRFEPQLSLKKKRCKILSMEAETQKMKYFLISLPK
jgi:hypothetical protein